MAGRERPSVGSGKALPNVDTSPGLAESLLERSYNFTNAERSLI